jgi:hypothetical protein
MRIHLELEDFKLATTSGPYGNARWLMVKLAGKPFTVVRQLESYGFREQYYMDEVDKVLVESMQAALEGLLLNAADIFPADSVMELRCPSEDSWRAHYDKRCHCGVQITEPVPL